MTLVYPSMFTIVDTMVNPSTLKEAILGGNLLQFGQCANVLDPNCPLYFQTVEGIYWLGKQLFPKIFSLHIDPPTHYSVH